MRTILTWGAILLMTGAASLRAQEPRPELVGARVRLTMATGDSLVPGRVVIGNLVAIEDSVLVIRPVEAQVEETFATSRIQRFEVRTGKNRGDGARFGAAVGLGAGLILGLLAGDDCSSSDFICFDRSETAVGGSVIGFGLGMWIGLLVGRGDRWSAEPVPARLSLAPAGEGRIRFAASFRF